MKTAGQKGGAGLPSNVAAYPHCGGCEGCRPLGLCNFCGTPTKPSNGRCTNGRCAVCHGKICTPGAKGRAMTAPKEGAGLLGLERENARLREYVRRLSYLAIDKGYGVWRCVKCDARYTTFPRGDAVCGESIFTEKGPIPCHGKLEPFAPEASQPTVDEDHALLLRALADGAATLTPGFDSAHGDKGWKLDIKDGPVTVLYADAAGCPALPTDEPVRAALRRVVGSNG